MDTAAGDPQYWPWIAGLSLFAIGLAGPFLVPTTLAPYSFVIVIPALLLASLIGESGIVIGAVLGSLITPMAFLLFVRHIRKTGELIPKASVITFVVLTVLSVLYAATGWEMTARYTSDLRATALVTQAVLPAVMIGVAWLAMRKHITLRRSLLLHWFACAWLAWSAFPWYGEML